MPAPNNKSEFKELKKLFKEETGLNSEASTANMEIYIQYYNGKMQELVAFQITQVAAMVGHLQR